MFGTWKVPNGDFSASPPPSLRAILLPGVAWQDAQPPAKNIVFPFASIGRMRAERARVDRLRIGDEPEQPGADQAEYENSNNESAEHQASLDVMPGRRVSGETRQIISQERWMRGVEPAHDSVYGAAFSS